MLRLRPDAMRLLAAVAAVALLLARRPASATPTVTQVIDAAGDHQGHGLDEPWGIGADAAGNVFVAAYLSNDVLQRTPDGTITAVLDATGDGLGHVLQGPDELVVGGDGSIYVTALGSNNVFKRTPGGVVTQLIDASGDGIGHTLQYPHGLAVDATGNVFVADSAGHQVFRVDAGGGITVVLTAAGDGAGHTLLEPGAMVTDPAGNLYVAGERSHNVFRVSPGGTVTEIANASAPLDLPSALALDAAGNLYVGDFGGYRLLRVPPVGAITEVVGGVEPVALAVRSDGVVLFADSNPHRITGVRPNGPACVVLDASGDGVHPFGFATRFVLLASGVVFASNSGGDGVFRIEDGCPAAPSADLSGRWLVSVAYPPSPFFPPPPPSAPFLQDWTQSTFDLTVSDPSTSAVTFTGTIDDRDHFFLTSVAGTCVVPGFCCPAHYLYGDPESGGRTWLATLTDNFFDPRFQCTGNPLTASATAFGSRCGNGVLDPGETCDDGNWTPGDGCDAACGTGSLCGNGVVEPGETCDDGNRIARDGCSPACQVELLCGDGILDTGEACDDGNIAAGDGCDAQCRVEPCWQCSGTPSACGASILTCAGTAGPGTSTLASRAVTSRRPPSLRWRLTTGSPITASMLGDPTAHTDYHLCVFDRSAATPRVLAHWASPSGASWRPSRTGFAYRLLSGTTSATLSVRAAALGKVDVRLRSPDMPSPPLALPLTVQLQTSDAGCFDAGFAATGATRNAANGFRGTSDR